MKILTKKSIFKTIIITLLISILVGSISFATTTSTTMSLDEMVEGANGFIQKGEADQKITIKEALDSFIPIGRIVVAFATIVLLIVGLVMGVKYMLAGANEKAQLKQKLIYYIIAIVLVYGMAGIVGIVVSIMNQITA